MDAATKRALRAVNRLPGDGRLLLGAILGMLIAAVFFSAGVTLAIWGGPTWVRRTGGEKPAELSQEWRTTEGKRLAEAEAIIQLWRRREVLIGMAGDILPLPEDERERLRLLLERMAPDVAAVEEAYALPAQARDINLLTRRIFNFYERLIFGWLGKSGMPGHPPRPPVLKRPIRLPPGRDHRALWEAPRGPSITGERQS